MTPVTVDISIEMLGLEREAFYNLCFITENDLAPRTLVVENLKMLLDNGYSRTSLAYNFCVGLFSKKGIPTVIIRAKRTNETYQQAFDADNNNDYYFIVIESKDNNTIKNFSQHLFQEPYKLLFYSSPENFLLNSKTVHYYQSLIPIKDVFNDNRTSDKHTYINKAYGLGYNTNGLHEYVDETQFANKQYYTFLGEPELTVSNLQNYRLAYPEASWIALCGEKFPSSVQWLYKYLPKADIVENNNIPLLSNASSIVLKDKSVIGSGKTNQNIDIHEQVSFDWVKWAIGQKVWRTLYSQNKINATQEGIELVVNDIKYVLGFAVEQGIFNKYKIIETKLDRITNIIVIRFTAYSTQTILEVQVNGSLKY